MSEKAVKTTVTNHLLTHTEQISKQTWWANYGYKQQTFRNILDTIIVGILEIM